jgi:Questin oxidase-like
MDSNMDEALERLRGAGPEMVSGMPNHGPMAVQALVALGCGDIAATWADRYRRELGVEREMMSPITAETWRSALGAIDRIGDWVGFFQGQLANAPWMVVFDEWIDRLLPGTQAAGSHGLIRTSHALRALDDGETPLRVEELGVSLAYWAAYYRELPGTPRLAGTLEFSHALDLVPRLTRGQDRRGLPRELALQVVGSHSAEIASAVNLAAEPQSAYDALRSLTEAGARLYLANRTHHPLIFIHAVTAPSALRALLPRLSLAQQQMGIGRVWQYMVAMTATYGDEIAVDHDERAPLATEEIVGRSVETGDPHAIKFAEACVREFHLNPQPIFLTAAQDWAMRLHGAKKWNQAEKVAAGIGILV